jgi:type IV pilus assembly protein PilP
MSGRRTSLAVLAVLVSGQLAGCTADTDELQGWMDQQRREAKPSVTALIPPKKFDPAPYSSAQAVEPFSALNRRKEPLEFFTLDGMSMVGSVTKQGRPFALLKVDSLLYQVKVGDYLGQNYGKITKITETEIALREIVQDAAGEWIERPSSLQLQEKAR